MSLCKACYLPTSIPNCETSPALDCELVKICGVFNKTEVKPLSSTNTTVLYCYRLELSNCTGSVLCNAQLSLALRWKYESDTLFQSFIPDLNAGVGLFAAGGLTAVLNNDGIYNITSNIPDAEPVNGDGEWNGDDLTELFQEPFALPPGKFVVTVCFEIRKEAMPNEGCPSPVLFPATADFVSSAPKNSACPLTVTTLVGCSPTHVCVVEPAPMPTP